MFRKIITFIIIAAFLLNASPGISLANITQQALRPAAFAEDEAIDGRLPANLGKYAQLYEEAADICDEMARDEKNKKFWNPAKKKFWLAMLRKHLGKLPFKARFFYNEDKFEIGDIRINPFSSSHDSLESSNFIFRKKGLKNKKLAVATDLGFSTRLTIKKLMNSSTIILESNHDEKMLIEGPYPWHLKQRVKGKQGHLSNEQAVGVISRIIHPGLKNLILAHLSEINNTPEIAHSLMEDYLKMVNHDLNLVVSNQYEPTKLVNI